MAFSLQGIVYTADTVHGLCAWRTQSPAGEEEMMGEDDLIIRHELPVENGTEGGDKIQEEYGAPSALAVDGDGDVRGTRKVNVTVGFSGGGFAMYQLDTRDPTSPIFRMRYLHRFQSVTDNNGPITTTNKQEQRQPVTAIASLGSFLSVMQQNVWTLYDFSKSATMPEKSTSASASGDTTTTTSNASTLKATHTFSAPTGARMIPQSFPITVALHPPQILASLRSSTVWPPISLSLRRSIQHTTLLATIIYAYPLYVSGWSVGIQELRFTTSSKSGETKMIESRIATAVEPGFSSFSSISPQSRKWVPGLGSWSRSQLNDRPIARPTSIAYNHP